MTTWTVEADGAGQRLDAWLARQPGIGSRGKAQDALACGKIFRNGKEQSFADAGRRLEAGDEVGFWPDRPGSSRPRRREVVDARADFDVVHEDDAILVVNKAPGWLVEPLPGEEGGEVTLLDVVVDYLRGSERRHNDVRAGGKKRGARRGAGRGAGPYVVHRIDRDTSGLVLFAMTSAARDHLKEQFERQSPERVYLAIVNGQPAPATGVWYDKLVWDKERLIQKRAHVDEARAKDAEAAYRVLETFRWQSLIEVRLRTGKRNQIRVQAGSRGYPLVGERQYRFGQPRDASREPAFDRQALHASQLGFIHPAVRRRVEFAAPLPDDMASLLHRLRLGR
jgi:23S rRNA pseudouridine1911/1915/1917 synthase